MKESDKHHSSGYQIPHQGFLSLESPVAIRFLFCLTWKALPFMGNTFKPKNSYAGKDTDMILCFVFKSGRGENN